MKKGKKISKKQAKKQPETIEEFGKEGEVTDDEIRELEDELKELPENYSCPQPDYNREMELQLFIGNFAVFRNAEGVLYGLSQQSEELVLKKIKVVV